MTLLVFGFAAGVVFLLVCQWGGEWWGRRELKRLEQREINAERMRSVIWDYVRDSTPPPGVPDYAIPMRKDAPDESRG